MSSRAIEQRCIAACDMVYFEAMATYTISTRTDQTGFDVEIECSKGGSQTTPGFKSQEDAEAWVVRRMRLIDQTDRPNQSSDQRSGKQPEDQRCHCRRHLVSAHSTQRLCVLPGAQQRRCADQRPAGAGGAEQLVLGQTAYLDASFQPVTNNELVRIFADYSGGGAPPHSKQPSPWVAP